MPKHYTNLHDFIFVFIAISADELIEHSFYVYWLVIIIILNIDKKLTFFIFSNRSSLFFVNSRYKTVEFKFSD